MVKLVAEDLLKELKRSGSFDQIRTQVIRDFIESSEGKELVITLTTMAKDAKVTSKEALICLLAKAPEFTPERRVFGADTLTSAAVRDKIKAELRSSLIHLNSKEEDAKNAVLLAQEVELKRLEMESLAKREEDERRAAEEAERIAAEIKLEADRFAKEVKEAETKAQILRDEMANAKAIEDERAAAESNAIKLLEKAEKKKVETEAFEAKKVMKREKDRLRRASIKSDKLEKVRLTSEKAAISKESRKNSQKRSSSPIVEPEAKREKLEVDLYETGSLVAAFVPKDGEEKCYIVKVLSVKNSLYTVQDADQEMLTLGKAVEWVLDSSKLVDYRNPKHFAEVFEEASVWALYIDDDEPLTTEFYKANVVSKTRRQLQVLFTDGERSTVYEGQVFLATH